MLMCLGAVLHYTHCIAYYNSLKDCILTQYTPVIVIDMNEHARVC